mmetsp:Transcript_88955/g.248392  ORF Transcript_88955/g.248392 Transcript_88955/m.248392 type:complete len:733 (+) Transcript_88955:978-3176(+)
MAAARIRPVRRWGGRPLGREHAAREHQHQVQRQGVGAEPDDREGYRAAGGDVRLPLLYGAGNDGREEEEMGDRADNGRHQRHGGLPQDGDHGRQLGPYEAFELLHAPEPVRDVRQQGLPVRLEEALRPLHAKCGELLPQLPPPVHVGVRKAPQEERRHKVQTKEHHHKVHRHQVGIPRALRDVGIHPVHVPLATDQKWVQDHDHGGGGGVEDEQHGRQEGHAHRYDAHPADLAGAPVRVEERRELVHARQAVEVLWLPQEDHPLRAEQRGAQLTERHQLRLGVLGDAALVDEEALPRQARSVMPQQYVRHEDRTADERHAKQHIDDDVRAEPEVRAQAKLHPAAPQEAGREVGHRVAQDGHHYCGNHVQGVKEGPGFLRPARLLRVGHEVVDLLVWPGRREGLGAGRPAQQRRAAAQHVAAADDADAPQGRLLLDVPLQRLVLRGEHLPAELQDDLVKAVEAALLPLDRLPQQSLVRRAAASRLLRPQAEQLLGGRAYELGAELLRHRPAHGQVRLQGLVNLVDAPHPGVDILGRGVDHDHAVPGNPLDHPLEGLQRDLLLDRESACDPVVRLVQRQRAKEDRRVHGHMGAQTKQLQCVHQLVRVLAPRVRNHQLRLVRKLWIHQEGDAAARSFCPRNHEVLVDVIHGDAPSFGAPVPRLVRLALAQKPQELPHLQRPALGGDVALAKAAGGQPQWPLGHDRPRGGAYAERLGLVGRVGLRTFDTSRSGGTT